MQIIIIVVIGYSKHFPSNSLFISGMSPIVDKQIPEGKHANSCREKTNESQTLSYDCKVFFFVSFLPVALAWRSRAKSLSTRFIKDLFQCNVL